MRISDWSSDVCSSDLRLVAAALLAAAVAPPAQAGTPDICAEATAALAMDLYSVAQARLDLCLALDGLSVEQRVRALQQRGDTHFAEDANELAIADYERALDLGGSDLEILVSLGRVHYHDDDYDAALAVLDRAVALDAESAPAHYYRGVVLYELSRYHDAVVALGRTITLRSEEHTSEL